MPTAIPINGNNGGVSVPIDELRMVGPWMDCTGYSKHARALLRCALAAGFTVEAVESDCQVGVSVTEDPETGEMLFSEQRIPRTDWGLVPDVQRREVETALSTRVSDGAATILLQLPDRLGGWREYSAGPRIGYTMVECDVIRPAIREAMRQVDLLLAPSHYVKRVFEINLKGRPVSLMPDPVDDRLFGPGLARPRKHPFQFVWVGSSHERKHWRELMHAFAEEFAGEDVGLFMKANKSSDMQHMAKMCRGYCAHVEINDEVWSDEQIAALYRSADCLVSVGCEGFGLPVVEGGLLGKPSILLNAGGLADFAGEPYAPDEKYLVRPTLMPTPVVGQNPLYFPSEASWASCAVAELRRALRRVYERRELLRESDGVRACMKAMTYRPERLAPELRRVVGRAWEIWAL